MQISINGVTLYKMNPNFVKMLHVKDHLSAMLQQQSNVAYGCSIVDYLDLVSSSGSHSCDLTKNAQNRIADQDAFDESWREKICEWLYDVIDHLRYDREIVAITLNYVDRYLSSYSKDSQRSINARLLQLLAVSALHIVLKINYSRVNHVPILLEFSRNLFSSKDIIAMERSILKSLDWKLSPPTSVAFLNLYIPFLAKGRQCLYLKHHEIIGETAQFLVELSVCDYYFVRKNREPSSIALASLLYAIYLVFSRSPAECKMVTNILLNNIQTHIGIKYCDETKRCKVRLEEIYGASDRCHKWTNSPCSVGTLRLPTEGEKSEEKKEEYSSTVLVP